MPTFSVYLHDWLNWNCYISMLDALTSPDDEGLGLGTAGKNTAELVMKMRPFYTRDCIVISILIYVYFVR